MKRNSLENVGKDHQSVLISHYSYRIRQTIEE